MFDTSTNDRVPAVRRIRQHHRDRGVAIHANDGVQAQDIASVDTGYIDRRGKSLDSEGAGAGITMVKTRSTSSTGQGLDQNVPATVQQQPARRRRSPAGARHARAVQRYDDMSSVR